MRVRKILVSFLVFVSVMILAISSVNASDPEYSFKISMSTSNTTVTRGQSVAVDVKMSNIDAGEYGISAISANLEYDTNLIEEIVSNGIGTSTSVKSTWDSDPKYNAGKLILAGSPATETTTIVTITFKIKSNAAYGTTTIKLKDLVGSNGLESINAADATITLTIAEGSGGDNNNVNNNANNNNNNNNANINYNNIQNTNTNSNTTTPNTVLPKAGIVEFALPIITVITIIAIGSYIKYRKM